MANPNPTGMGLTQGLDAAQDSTGPSLPPRPDRARANNAKFGVPCDNAEGHADGDTDPSFNPLKRVFSK